MLNVLCLLILLVPANSTFVQKIQTLPEYVEFSLWVLVYHRKLTTRLQKHYIFSIALTVDSIWFISIPHAFLINMYPTSALGAETKLKRATKTTISSKYLIIYLCVHKWRNQNLHILSISKSSIIIIEVSNLYKSLVLLTHAPDKR